MKNKYIGTDFDDFLKEEGIFEESSAGAVKKVIAWQIRSFMKKEHLSKKEMTARMGIKSRMQLDRLLDPKNVSVTLLSLEKTANAMGKQLRIQFV